MVFRRYRSCSFDSVRFRRCRLFLRDLVSDDAGYPFKGFVSDDAGRGALRSPTPPRATGCERGASLSRSPGAGLAGSLVSDDAGGCPFDGVRFRQCRGCPFDDVRFRQCGAVLLTAFVSDKAGTALLRFFFPDGASVGRSAPLHSLGDGVREGFDPLALSRGWSGGEFGFRRCRGCPFDGVRFRQCRGCPFDDVRFRQCRAVLLTAFVSDEAGTALLRIFVPVGAGVRRSAPLHSLGRRGARGLRSSRALPGLLWRGVRFPTMQGLFF